MPKYHRFGKITAIETDSGKTWKIRIRKSFWDGTVGLRESILKKAGRRRIQVYVADRDVTFTVPAWRWLLEYKRIEWLESKFPNGKPMKILMFEIPPEKLREARKREENEEKQV